MSSRLVAKDQCPAVRPFAWPALQPAAPVAAAPDQLDHARMALADSAAEIDALRGKVADLEQALQSREKVGFEKGFAEGQNHARKESAEQMRPVLDRMSRSIADAAMLRARLRTESETDLVRLCAAIAQRILKRELEMDPLAIAGIVQAALARAGALEICNVRVHPSHAGDIRAQLTKLGVPESVRVDASPSLDVGDVIIETSAGQIDASVNTQIAEVERGLTACIAS